MLPKECFHFFLPSNSNKLSFSNLSKWGCGAVVSASALQAEGQGFKPPLLQFLFAPCGNFLLLQRIFCFSWTVLQCARMLLDVPKRLLQYGTGGRAASRELSCSAAPWRPPPRRGCCSGGTCSRATSRAPRARGCRACSATGSRRGSAGRRARVDRELLIDGSGVLRAGRVSREALCYTLPLMTRDIGVVV